nr:MipA/OmpV family protein [Desulfobacterales bacterium]
MKTRKTIVLLLTGIFVVVLLAPIPDAVAVIGNWIPTDVEVQTSELGIGLGLAPDYEGSEDYEFVPVLYARTVWASGQYLQFLANDLRANVLPSHTWSFGPMLEYIRSRADVDNNRVDDMQNVDASVMLGVFGSVKIDRWNASLELRQDIADNNGFLATLRGGYNLPINEQLRLGFGVSTTYADGDYMNTYFSVDSGDAARSGLKEYDADSGFKDVGMDIKANYKIHKNWGLIGIVRYIRLVGDAEDSPVVDDEGDENQFFVGALVKYSFQLCGTLPRGHLEPSVRTRIVVSACGV